MKKSFLIAFVIFFGIAIIAAGELLIFLLIQDSIIRMYLITVIFCGGGNIIIYLIARHIEKKEIAQAIQKIENENKQNENKD